MSWWASGLVGWWDSGTVGPLSHCPLTADDGLYSRKKGGSGAFRRPGSSRHWADALGSSGSARRAGWFRGRFIVSLWREAVFPKARGGRPPLAGRGSALRFRAGRGLCRRVVKAMTAGEKYRVTLTSYSSPEGRYHHPRPKGPLPPFAQPAAAGGHNLQPRRGWLPSPLNPLNSGRGAALYIHYIHCKLHWKTVIYCI